MSTDHTSPSAEDLARVLDGSHQDTAPLNEVLPMTQAATGPTPTFRMHTGRVVWDLVLDEEATTQGATEIPDIAGLSLPEAAQRYREHNLGVFPWRLVDGGKNLGAFVGKGYHKLAATITPAQARELCELDENVTGLGLTAGRSGIVAFDVDRPELIPPLLKRAIEECNPPYQTTRVTETPEGQVPRGHYIFGQPEGRRIGSPTKWTGGNPGSLNWGEVRGWNSGIAIGPGQHPKPEGFYRWARTGRIPVMPDYLADTLPEYVISAEPATDDELAQMRAMMTRRTDPAAVQRAMERHNADGAGLNGRHGATLYLALDLAREMVVGRINYDDFVSGVEDFFLELVQDPTRRHEPEQLCRWALGQTLSDAAAGKIPGVSPGGVATELPAGTDVTEVGHRTTRTTEIYTVRGGRPIGMADDMRRKADVLHKMARRVASTEAASRLITEIDRNVIPVLVDWSAIGNLRQGSTPEKAAEHQAREETARLAIENAVRVSTEDRQTEINAYSGEDGAGVSLSRAAASRWAELDVDDITVAIIRGYRQVFRSQHVLTPHHDDLETLSDGRRRQVAARLTEELRTHARAIAYAVSDPDGEEPLPQPSPSRRVPICLDTTELRIDGVNTYLNTWAPNPNDVSAGGDMFMFRGKAALYSRRGGQIDEAREIQHIAPAELIALTNDRAEVYETGPEGAPVVAELAEGAAKVGLAAIRRTLARTLTEVASTPIITADGALVPDATYDRGTGVLVACDVDFELAPENPTDAQVQDALDRLDAFYGDIRFMGPGDRAAFWAFMYTIPLRRRLNGAGWRAVPAAGVRAGKANAGKTLISEAIGGLHGSAFRRLPEGEEELRKTILSAYESRPSAQVLVLNNVPNGSVLDSASLAEVITEPTVEGRKLGSTGEDITHANNKLLVINGNRWRPHDDLVSRIVPIGVLPVVGRDDRVFRTPDLEARLRTPEHHAEVLYLLHVVIRAWIAAGAPEGVHHDIRGNFRAWAKMIDGVLTFAGIKGFGENFGVFAEMEENSDEDFLSVLAELYEPDVWFTRADIETKMADVDGMTDPANLLDRKLAEHMPRDSKASSVTGSGKRAPLSGRKLTSMLKAQLDLPIQRTGKPLVSLKVAVREGERGFKFEEIPD